MPGSSLSVVDFEQVNVWLVNVLPTILFFKNSIEIKTSKSTKLILNCHEC